MSDRPASPSLPVAERPDPHAQVKVFRDYGGPVRDECDVVVVGSGPGGAVVARELAALGRDVVLLEEGPPFGVKDFVLEAGHSMRRTMREAGFRAARGKTFLPTMQAIALGGGSLVNSAICVRPPAWVLERWQEQHGIDYGLPELVEHYARVEAFLDIAPTPEDVLGERNLLFKKACDALDMSSEPIPRNVKGCRGSGECFTGCRAGAKRSTDVSYVPAAIRDGARVYTSVRAEKLLLDGRRATGVTGRVIEPFTWREGPEVTIHARKAVVLAAGVMATPLILVRSNAAGPSGQVGRNLQFHPGGAIMGIFEHDVDPWFGATQGYQSLHYLKEGFKLEVLWSPPAVLATRFPGFGHEFQHHLSRFRRMAPFDVIVSGTKSFGTVRPRSGSWDPDIRYDMHPEDVKVMHRGLCVLRDMLWAAGAKSLITGIHGLPAEIDTVEEGKRLDTLDFRPELATLAGNHTFGATRMGSDPKSSVVDPDGRCHHLDNVYVGDTGIMPMSPAVNPMHTLMALADRIAGKVHAAA